MHRIPVLLACLLLAPGPLLADAKGQVAQLVAQLKSKDTTERRKAAEELGKLGPDAHHAIHAIADVLKDKDPHVKRLAVRALVQVGTDQRETVQELTRGLVGPGVVKKSGLDGMETMQALAKSVKEQERDVLEAIVEALGSLGPPAVPPLIALVKEPDPLLRRLAAKALGKIGPDAKDAVPALIEAFTAIFLPGLGFDTQMRAAIAQALGDIGPDAKDAIPELKKVAESRVVRDRTLKTAAAEAIKKIEK